MSRVLVTLATTCLAGLTLAGCSSTASTQECKDGKCEIHLAGKGSTVKLEGNGDNDLELISAPAGGKTAKVRIKKATGTLKIGVPINRNESALTLVSVDGEDDIKLTLDTTTGTFLSPAAKTPGTTPKK